MLYKNFIEFDLKLISIILIPNIEDLFQQDNITKNTFRKNYIDFQYLIED